MNIKINAKIHAYTPARLTDNIVRWREDLPFDKSRIQFTRITIDKVDAEDYVKQLEGKHVVIDGYTENGFDSGTIVCEDNSETDSTHPFIGSISRKSDNETILVKGIFIKPDEVSIVNNSYTGTLSFEYLW